MESLRSTHGVVSPVGASVLGMPRDRSVHRGTVALGSAAGTDDIAASASGPNPQHILQVGMGFWASKTLLSAVELNLFTLLGLGPMTATELGERLGLHPRSRLDFLDALVSLGLLARDGDGPSARYANTADTAMFLDYRSPAYVGGMLEMANSRLYAFWGDLTEALTTGQPQNEAKHGNGDFFAALYADEQRLEEFLRAMQGIQMGSFLALVDRVDLSSTATLVDIGGASGILSALAAQRHRHLRAITFDLPAVEPIAKRTLVAMGVHDRVTTVSGDFFVDEWPSCDVVVLGNILHDWNSDQKQLLIDKAYGSLNRGGRLIAIENVIDDTRRHNTFALLMSLNMLIETAGGVDYTATQFNAWCRHAGFTHTEIIPLAGPTSAAIAHT
jgi:precorrin-6B methylase 2